MRVLYLILAVAAPLAATHAGRAEDGIPTLSPRPLQPMAALTAQPMAAPVLVPTCAPPSDWRRAVDGDMAALQDYARCQREALEAVQNELIRRGLR